MALTIVYVHGNGNKAPAEALKLEWDLALFGQDMGSASRMAYWAPVRYPRPLPDREVDELDQLPSSPLESAAPPQVAPPEAFISQVAQEASGQAAAEGTLETAINLDAGAGREGLESWLGAMTYAADALTEGESAAPPATSPFEALPFPKPLRIAAFRALVKRTFVDVYAYLFGDAKEPIRKVLRSTLDGIDGPVVVVGHSLGSIVAYDVLREQGSASLEVPLLFTVGSPLGVKEVQDLVEQPLAVPAGVAAWRNASDARDLVALDHTIRPEYPPVDKCTDLVVVNDSANHHGIREYLRAVPVRQPILELFQR